MSETEVKKGRPKLPERTHISREAIRQTEQNALRKLRRKMSAFGYKAEDFFDVWKRKG
jgi:DNA-directed RNA polymerase sigma subunit (sigma70/sigma32)